jgi:hypothetical protein
MNNESKTLEELQKGYDSFIILREKMASSNKKYRLSEKGKIVTKRLHKLWTDKKKDDLKYVANINKNQRERYRIRKLEKMENKLNDEKKSENTIV